MINRPLIKNHPYRTYNYVVELRSQFNQVLQTLARKAKYALVCEMPDETLTANTFDSTGNLTYEGKKSFWIHVDNQLRHYELISHTALIPWMQPKQKAEQKGTFPQNWEKMQKSGKDQKEKTQQSEEDYRNSRHSNHHHQHTRERTYPNRTTGKDDIWGEAGHMAAKFNNRHY